MKKPLFKQGQWIRRIKWGNKTTSIDSIWEVESADGDQIVLKGDPRNNDAVEYRCEPSYFAPVNPSKPKED